MRTVALLGATGLVGRELLAQLLADPGVAVVRAIGRRPMEPRAKLESVVVDFDRLDAHADALAVDQLFCALGTTIKVAGSQQRFRQVDHDYPVVAAALARAAGARHFLLVSALGADVASRVFYNRVKGEVEQAVQRLGYPTVTIVRPSLLLGDRGEQRLGEEVAKRFAWLVPRRWAPVHARDVARSLVEAARGDAPGVRVIESREIGG